MRMLNTAASFCRPVSGAQPSPGQPVRPPASHWPHWSDLGDQHQGRGLGINAVFIKWAN